MSYNLLERPSYIQTAGRVTIAAAVSGLLIFTFIFLFNAGKTEIFKVEAATGSATTTLTVLNTPPIWITLAYEETESSTSTPTNSGDEIVWVALADNNGGAPYFLIVCNDSATATPNAAVDLGSLGTAPPTCTSGITWGVSTATAALAQARVATTTTEAFAESNIWYAWVCDDDPVNPRCNNTGSQGLSATNSSPFAVNHRPVFTTFTNDSPTIPGAVITFYSTSTDPDIVDAEDNLTLYVCNANDFTTAPPTCGAGGTIATTTIPVTADATAAFTLPSVIQDDVYDAYGFIVDEHGHAALGGAQATNVTFTVSNVAPTVAGGSVILNNGTPITIVEGVETSGFTLSFDTSDANSCINYASTTEVVSYVASVFRGSYGTSSCNGTAGSYDPNYCYPSGVATTTWNLSCTASSTTCGGPSDATQTWECTFPLWFIAEPTDGSSPWSGDDWVAAVAAVDDNNATGTFGISASPVQLVSLSALDLITAEIPYGALEPGEDSVTLNATTTIYSVGNTGINENLTGQHMCTGFLVGSPCATSASSTIEDFNQQFATSSVAYGSGTALSSTTVKQLDLKIFKSTSTTTPNSGVTYWGIGVPGSITVAGAYTGLNTFSSVISSSTDWF